MNCIKPRDLAEKLAQTFKATLKSDWQVGLFLAMPPADLPSSFEEVLERIRATLPGTGYTVRTAGRRARSQFSKGGSFCILEGKAVLSTQTRNGRVYPPKLRTCIVNLDLVRKGNQPQIRVGLEVQ